MRLYWLLKIIFDSIVRKDKKQDIRDMPVYRKRYSDYLSFQLEWIRKLCREKGAKLVLLSYYNSSDNVIKEFAYKYHIPYIDFTSDFQSLFKIEDRSRYISSDTSHMNHLGYKLFAEQLYERLFLQQVYLGN